jgi:hypothetical protein
MKKDCMKKKQPQEVRTLYSWSMLRKQVHRYSLQVRVLLCQLSLGSNL